MRQKKRRGGKYPRPETEDPSQWWPYADHDGDVYTVKPRGVPRIFISPEAKTKIHLYAKHARGEISGFGIVHKIDGDLHIVDVFLPGQTCSSSETESTGEQLAQLMMDVMTAGYSTEDMKLWWHSHGEMNVFWSATDEATAQGFSNEWMLSLVVNNKGEYKLRLDIDVPIPLTFDELELEVLMFFDEAAEEAIKQEIAAKVVTLVPVYRPINMGQGNVNQQPVVASTVQVVGETQAQEAVDE